MEIEPTEKEARKNWLPLIADEVLLAQDACLQFEIKLISLEHVLYNKMWDEEYILRLVNRNLCTEITKLREHVNKKFYYLERKILRIKLYKNMDESEDSIYESEDSIYESEDSIYESEDPGLDEIIN